MSAGSGTIPPPLPRPRNREWQIFLFVLVGIALAAAITNAQAYLRMKEDAGGLAPFLWAYVDGKPIQNAWKHLRDCPAKTPLSDRISKDLSKRGFKFVGSTIIYAYMQATGMVNDHCVDCFRHSSLSNP